MSKDRERKRLPVQKHCLIVIIIITHCCHGNRVECAGIAISSHCHPAPTRAEVAENSLLWDSKSQCQRRDSERGRESPPQNIKSSQHVTAVLRRWRVKETETVREKCGHTRGQNTDSKIFVYVLFAGSSTKLLFPHPFYLTGGSFFFLYCWVTETTGGRRDENFVVLTFLLDSVSLFTMTSRWNLLTLGE